MMFVKNIINQIEGLEEHPLGEVYHKHLQNENKIYAHDAVKYLWEIILKNAEGPSFVSV